MNLSTPWLQLLAFAAVIPIGITAAYFAGRSMFRFVASVITFFGSVMVLVAYSQWKTGVQDYQTKHLARVCGPVTEYVPRYAYQVGEETFVVGGHEFHVSSNESRAGFTRDRASGSPYAVERSYVIDYDGDNIVRIEIQR